MGLDILLRWKGQSADDRENVFSADASSPEVTYLRSAYRDGGFENWANQQLGGRGFHWIFDWSESAQTEMTFDDGTQEVGLQVDWEACRLRTLVALQLAREIPDRVYATVITTLVGDVQELPATHDAVEKYREVLNERKSELEKSSSESVHSSEDDSPGFKSNHGFFSAGRLPNIKAVMLCRLNNWPELVLVCEGPPNLHQPYLKILEETLRFIDCGARKDGWILWSG